eukprot:784394-Rhodomonas_salina.1
MVGTRALTAGLPAANPTLPSMTIHASSAVLCLLTSSIDTTSTTRLPVTQSGRFGDLPVYALFGRTAEKAGSFLRPPLAIWRRAEDSIRSGLLAKTPAGSGQPEGPQQRVLEATRHCNFPLLLNRKSASGARLWCVRVRQGCLRPLDYLSRNAFGEAGSPGTRGTWPPMSQ